ncbi:MAG: hypothetical protein GKR94_16530 [Gammaproteobacteria bacterium]|nr:hypothetical protein [Gammaproteobacteria bacterium]
MNTDDALALASPAAWTSLQVQRLMLAMDERLRNHLGIVPERYSTARVLMGAQEERAFLPCEPHSGWPPRFGVELVSPPVQERVAQPGAILLNRDEVEALDVRRSIELAMVLIHSIAPRIHATVAALVRSIHPLSCPCPEVDVSYSLPELPHSVFVAVPCEGPKVPRHHVIARLAEGLIHESVHLQLSGIEHFFPLTRRGAQEEYAYSPWRREHRPITGVIHGLFVFNCLWVFWRYIADQPAHQVADFAAVRIGEIGRDFEQVEFIATDSLSAFGVQVLERNLGIWH